MKQASLEGMLFERLKMASPAYRRAVMIVLRGKMCFYGPAQGVSGRSKGPGFMATQAQYNGAWK